MSLKKIIFIISIFSLYTSFANIPDYLNLVQFEEKSSLLTDEEKNLILSTYSLDSSSIYKNINKNISSETQINVEKIFNTIHYHNGLKDNIFYRLSMLGLHPYIIIFITAMLPIIELRGSIPVGILFFELPAIPVILISILGNFIPVFFIIFLLEHIEPILRKIPLFNIIFDKVFSITRSKSAALKEYEELGLILFVGVPLPVTGAWTGSLIAYLLSFKMKQSLISIFIGVITAAAIVSAFTYFGVIGIITGLSIAVIGMVIKTIISRISKS